MNIADVMEKVVRRQVLKEDELRFLTEWFSRADRSPAETTNQVLNNAQGGLISSLSTLSRNLGLFTAGEIRTGNDKAPGDGFTGGRFGFPGFDYGGTTYFLAGVNNDVLQVGLSLADGKVYAGAGAVVLSSTGITATAGTIGGWVIGSDSIKDAAGAVGMLSTVTGGDDIRFFAGHVTPSSAPFRVTEAGALVASNATITGSITATSGTIGGWSISGFALYKFSSGNIGILLGGSDSTIRVGDTGGNHIVIDGANQRIRSSNYLAGASGMNIDTAVGDAEFNNITARGELKTFLLTSSNQMAVAGNILVSKDAGKLGAAVAAADTTVNFGKAMTVSDWVKFQGPDTAGTTSLEWMLVGSLVSGTTYNVTRNVDGSGANNWADDTPFVVIGQNGTSRIEIVAGATGSIQLITQGATWNAQTVQASMSTVAGAITAGGGNVTINAGGITFENNANYFGFKDTGGSVNMYIYGSNADELVLVNNTAGKKISLTIKTTDGGAPYLKLYEDSLNANVSQLDLSLATVGSKISIGGEVVIWAKKTGTTTVFNESGLDIDFRVESDNDANALKVDAALDRVEIGADHFIPTRVASNKNVYFNEANQDMDFAVEGDNSGQVLYIDAGLDKATSFAWDGWQQMDHHTWTRTGNYTFTVSGDVTATYRKGAKVRYKDGGSYEYGVIASSSHAAGTTTVTLITNSDYAMAAATITDRYLSYIENPEGFPTSFNYSITVSSTAGTITSYTVQQAVFTPMPGAKLKVDVQFTITNNGTGSGGVQFGAPVTTVTTSTGHGRENAATGAMLQAYTSGANIIIFTYANGYPGGTNYVLYLSIFTSY